MAFSYNRCHKEIVMIQLSQVKKLYPIGNSYIEALRGVNLSLDDTGFVFITGPSGCGKTTLLNIIGGLDHPDTGTVLFHATDTKDYTEEKWNDYRNHQIGFVFQNFYLIPHLSILENVMMPLKLAGISLSEQKQRAEHVLRSVHLESFSHHRPNQLSGGQQQRAAIARALVNEPKIVLADEPTGSLDQQASLEIMGILKEISQDRLVVMVTHNTELSKQFADRMIVMEDGLIKDDLIVCEKVSNNIHTSFDLSQSKMSIMTSFMLSFKNLNKRLTRTLLIIIAASIGMIGMTLVVAVAYGFDQFIELRKTETLNAFPIRVEKVSAVVPFVDDSYQPQLPLFSDNDVIYPRNIQYEFQTINTLTNDYYEHVKLMDSSLYESIFYNFGANHSFIIDNNGPQSVNQTLKELPVDSSYLMSYFDLLEGRMPDDSKNEMIVIVDRYNRLSKDIVEQLGFSSSNTLLFNQLMSLDAKWIPNNIAYTFNGSYYVESELNQAFAHSSSLSIPIVGVLRIKDRFNLDLLNTGLYYTKNLGVYMRQDAMQSAIVASQNQSNVSVFDGSSFSTSKEKQDHLRDIGFSNFPIGYTIYSKSFDDKDEIMNYLKSYNENIPINDQVEPLDVAGIGLSTMRIAIDAITIILLVFSLISLLISNLMIGVMTYTSVIERTKEIGILRAIGARKKDIGFIFYAETLLIGFFSGVLGIIISYLLIPLLNLFLKGVTEIAHLSKLPIIYALSLILITVVLTSISSVIPAHIASNKDPILCLRNE